MTKPWTATPGPIAATELDVAKAAAINALLTNPIGILPGAPGDEIRPFAIGLFEEIRPLLRPEMTVTRLRKAVASFVHSKRYYVASAQPDSARHDIDGKPVEPLSDKDRTIARNRLLPTRKAAEPKSEDDKADISKVEKPTADKPKEAKPKTGKPKTEGKMQEPTAPQAAGASAPSGQSGAETPPPTKNEQIRAALLKRSRPPATSSSLS